MFLSKDGTLSCFSCKESFYPFYNCEENCYMCHETHFICDDCEDYICKFKFAAGLEPNYVCTPCMYSEKCIVCCNPSKNLDKQYIISRLNESFLCSECQK